METLRDSIISIPGALSNMFSESGSSPRSSTSEGGGGGGTPHSEKSFPIPASLVKEQWRLIFTLDPSAEDLKRAIAHCRDLVVLTEEYSEERRWLVRHLVDLRYALKELEDQPLQGTDAAAAAVAPVKTVVGHHFVVNQKQLNLPAAIKRHCDHCTGIIWNLLQRSYVCTDCEFLAHQKCVDHVVRVCAHVVASERQYPIIRICPEMGLAAQKYRCAECQVVLNFKNSWIEPRLCDYNGLFYCPSCHWNDTSPIPARIVHNWDFSARKVSRASLQEIRLFRDKPVIHLEQTNPKLFAFILKLRDVRTLRQKLVYMRKYLVECRHAVESKMLDNLIGNHRHLMQSTEFYSIADIEQVENGQLRDLLHKVAVQCEAHIRQCELCISKAYICEICSNQEVIFPFDDGCVLCDKCNSIYHHACYSRKMTVCPKCVRLKERNSTNQHRDDEDDDDIAV